MRLAALISIFIFLIGFPGSAAPIFQKALHPVLKETAGPAKFKILRLIVQVEKRPSTLTETQESLRVYDRSFSMEVTVHYDVPKDEHWVIGIIQQIESPSINSYEYPEATLSWEFPELPFCDTPSKSDAPWPGDLSYRSVSNTGISEVSTNDHLYNAYDWAVPVPPKGDNYGKSELLSIKRTQNFIDWLVACRESDGAVVVLKRITWGSSFTIKIHPENFLGERATLTGSRDIQPIVEDVSDAVAVSELSDKVLSGNQVSNLDQGWWWTPKGKTPGVRVRLK
jgi:hypothetical protein